MVICRVSSWAVAAFFTLGPWTASAASTVASNRCASVVQSEVAAAASKLMATYDIPGMAVGVLACGRSRVFNYGVESTTTQVAVSAGTLFEIGSISKTFTATLAAYAQVNGKLSLSDKVGKFLPALRDSSFGNVSLLHLATYTLGGLPLQVPDAIASSEQLMEYLQAWHPTYTPGTHRTYSNISIGVLGLIAAKSMGAALGLGAAVLLPPTTAAALCNRGIRLTKTRVSSMDLLVMMPQAMPRACKPASNSGMPSKA